MKKKSLIISAVVIFLDLLSKYLVFLFFPYQEEKTVIKNFFQLYPIKNKGAAFSSFENMNYLLISISVIILIYLIFTVLKRNGGLIKAFSYGFLIGGLIGNLFDRLIYGYVRDFLSFSFGNFNFAIFNVADIFIVVGAILLFIFSFKEGRKSEN